VLARLHGRFALGIATNSLRADVAFVLDRLAIAHFFTAVVTREDYAEAKPAPDAYLTAAQRLGIAPGRCLVFEDAERGVVAAHRAGATVVAVPNTFTAGSDFSLAATVVDGLAVVSPAFVERLLGAAPATGH